MRTMGIDGGVLRQLPLWWFPGRRLHEMISQRIVVLLVQYKKEIPSLHHSDRTLKNLLEIRTSACGSAEQRCSLYSTILNF